jgi:prepilin-type N-terminal cleavage/methylation domain-containing protein
MSSPHRESSVCSVAGNKRGFTALELIVVMTLVGVIGVVAGLAFTKVVQGVVFTKKNAETVQKGQIAVTKLVKECNNITDVTSGVSTWITFTSIKNGASGTRKIMFSGDRVTFNDSYSESSTEGDVLTDQVSGFSLKYYNYDIDSSTDQGTWQPSSRVIEITLELTGADQGKSRFTARVRPRNIERR